MNVVQSFIKFGVFTVSIICSVPVDVPLPVVSGNVQAAGCVEYFQSAFLPMHRSGMGLLPYADPGQTAS